MYSLRYCKSQILLQKPNLFYLLLRYLQHHSCTLEKEAMIFAFRVINEYALAVSYIALVGAACISLLRCVDS